MKVILAKNSGFCFGVQRAVDRALQLAEQGEQVVTLGDLIHNSIFVDYLKGKGVVSVDDIDEIGDRKALIRSHGVSPEIYSELGKRGIPYEDLTCPKVSLIHRRVYDERDAYDHIIIVGKASHPEVIGTKGWIGEKAIVVGSPEEAEALPELGKVLVVAQTTINEKLFDDVSRIVKEKSSDVTLFNSICATTLQRQNEVRELSSRVDAMIVIGDRNSSNSRQLYELARTYCKRAYFVEKADELNVENFTGCDIIGISAGASTPDWIIMEVCALMELNETQVTNEEVVEQEATEEVAVETEPVAEVVEETVEPAAETKEESDAEFDFEAELNKSLENRLRKGALVKGKVVSVNDDEIVVDIGYKADGLLKTSDLLLEDGARPSDVYKEGDDIEAQVVTLNDGQGNVILSRQKIEGKLKWQNFVDSIDKDAIYECMVTRAVKGGVATKFDEYDAFIPASHLTLNYVADLDEFVGQKLLVKIIDINMKTKRFVLSNKEALQQQIDDQQKAIFESLEKGSVVAGVVKRITDFGAFVDVGGVDGLLHVRDMSWIRGTQPKDILKEGQEIEVKILNVDPEKKKISLGYKQLQPKPWDLAGEKYKVGESVTGKVVRIAPFGAFVELEPTIDGLVHISQVTNKRIEKVEDVLNLGDEITAKILEVNPDKQRISLSIRALMRDERKAQEDEEKKTRKEERVVIPAREEATTSLADLFKQAQESAEETTEE
ncbi:MAG: bifunctional 4-hydroxy-3-methylbut-2-enyl diphosphate reductase/30S ribosomal protein S1 [Clostridia bacterium]|nr:bifunctional 4-hydroxy-3-methylbut-2-enyl diphosphate reductase/30S ribosomal protein S1 [Clostridia bacterium]